MHAQFLSGSIPRFLFTAIGEKKFSFDVLHRLLDAYRSDPGARILLGWLARATLDEHPDILQDSIEEFHDRWIPVSQEHLNEAVDAHIRQQRVLPEYTDGKLLLENLA